MVTVAENIDLSRINTVQRRQRRFQPEDHFKTIEIDVKPDTTYHIAARLKIGASMVRHQHWDPVVSSEVGEPCHGTTAQGKAGEGVRVAMWCVDIARCGFFQIGAPQGYP